jgi:heme exporter protein C
MPVFSRLANKVIQIGAVVLITYALAVGLIIELPKVGDLGQTSRNLFYHVPMWFTMYLMMFTSVAYSVMFIAKGKIEYDCAAKESAITGIGFGLMGLFTGVVWSRVTWGQLMPDSSPAAWWSWDPKQTGALVAILMYLAYFVLRSAVEEESKKARLAAVYNIFAAASLIPLTLIIPRILGGLHPGGDEGSPVFNSKDISPYYRLVFYPAIIGFMCLALWVTQLRIRLFYISQKLTEKE